MKRRILPLAILTCGGLAASGMVFAQTLPLVAVGNLTQSRAGSYTDLSGLTYTLENGVPANLLGGLGSGITYAGGNTFLALPDRGPNAVSYNGAVDDTVSYVNRFHRAHADREQHLGNRISSHRDSGSASHHPSVG